MSDYTKINEQVINRWKKQFNFYWMIPLSHEEFVSIKNGANLLTVTPYKYVPYEWYSDCKGKEVLGIAAGGGQQMAVFSALGAHCTLLDISDEQIKSDLLVSEREGYKINIVKGDMSERLPFDDESFDIVINPISNHYIRDLQPFFNEIYRVLKKGGIFIAGMENEIYWAVTPNTNILENKLPVDPLSDKALYDDLIQKGYALQFSHTTSEQIGCQLKAGFVLKDIYDDTEEGVFENLNLPTFIATYSKKYFIDMKKQVNDNIPKINTQRKVVFVFACPGNEEFKTGKPCAGQTGKNLKILLKKLNEVNPKLFDSLDIYDYRIINSSIFVHPNSDKDKSVPSMKEIKTKDNLDRFNLEINSDDHVICFGRQAENAIKFYVKSNKISKLDYRQTHHLSLSYINRKIKLKNCTLDPGKRNVERVLKSAKKIIEYFGNLNEI